MFGQGVVQSVAAHLVQHRGRRRGESFQVVAAFQDRGAAPRGVVARHAQQNPREACESGFGHVQAAQRVARMGVEAGRDQHELRLELPADGRDHVLEQRQKIGVPQARRHRQVDGEARSTAPPRILRGARARVVGILVSRDVQHARVVIETVLRAVAVMQVPIHDQDTAQAEPRAQILRAHGHAVEQTEPHRAVAFGVVARRAYQGEAVVHLAFHDRVQHAQQPAAGQQCGLVRPRTDARIRVERRGRLSGRRRHAPDQAGVVNQRDFLMGGEPGREPHEPRAPIRLHAAQQAADPVRAFGMPGAGVVLLIARVQDDAGFQPRLGFRHEVLSRADGNTEAIRLWRHIPGSEPGTSESDRNRPQGALRLLEADRRAGRWYAWRVTTSDMSICQTL